MKIIPGLRSALVPLALALWFWVGMLGAAELQSGDLIYLALKGVAGGAISNSSGSIASHIGIVTVQADGVLRVIHAYGRVREEPLERFLAKGTGPYAVNRFPFVTSADRAAFVAGARGFLGWPYDRKYRIDNRSLYCSELVYRAFLDGNGRVPVALTPMDFESAGEEVYEFWKRFFQGDVPQGEPGISPGAYLESPTFELIVDTLREAP
jgi:hypothetical protein